MAKAPKARRLKVYRTAIGFHDAYVAAPSRAAALRAWGSDKDLFARGAAEEVTDPALTAEALAAPDTVIKRLRGTAAEQLAALPPKAPKRKAKDAPPPDVTAPPRTARKPPTPPPKPEPSRAALDEAEATLAAAQARQKEALGALAEREAALARERRDLERTQASETRRLTRDRDDAADDYQAAMRRWRR
ncbi:hypothetical protein [Sphingomonas sp.]|jgi:hypothetical protein|uniref:hypothetical protein n=1 Tax=Sphingomonas sp. TaxID=28214 RepID=UPI002ED9DEE1